MGAAAETANELAAAAGAAAAAAGATATAAEGMGGKEVRTFAVMDLFLCCQKNQEMILSGFFENKSCADISIYTEYKAWKISRNVKKFAEFETK